MKLGILGATGAVGMQMIKCLEERNIDCELKLFASKKSAGKNVKVKICGNEKDIVIEEATENSFAGLDFVLGAVESGFARIFAPHIVKAGAIFIDNSNAFRMENDVPLVVPEINANDAKNNKGIISNPNCSTIITDMAIYSINKISKIKSIIASTYQAVSGAGVYGMLALDEQINYISKHDKLTNHKIDNNFTTEEMKMQNETRKIMHLPDLKVTCTCVRVPVMRSHSISVTLDLEKKLSVSEVKSILKDAKGVKLVDDKENSLYPMPLNTTDLDIVEVGRIREDLVFDNGISLFCCGDQIRKGAASNAVQILELFI